MNDEQFKYCNQCGTESHHYSDCPLVSLFPWLTFILPAINANFGKFPFAVPLTPKGRLVFDESQQWSWGWIPETLRYNHYFKVKQVFGFGSEPWVVVMGSHVPWKPSVEFFVRQGDITLHQILALLQVTKFMDSSLDDPDVPPGELESFKGPQGKDHS